MVQKLCAWATAGAQSNRWIPSILNTRNKEELRFPSGVFIFAAAVFPPAALLSAHLHVYASLLKEVETSKDEMKAASEKSN